MKEKATAAGNLYPKATSNALFLYLAGSGLSLAN
jgi:hypothetical protein